MPKRIAIVRPLLAGARSSPWASPGLGRAGQLGRRYGLERFWARTNLRIPGVADGRNARGPLVRGNYGENQHLSRPGWETPFHLLAGSLVARGIPFCGERPDTVVQPPRFALGARRRLERTAARLAGRGRTGELLVFPARSQDARHGLFPRFRQLQQTPVGYIGRNGFQSQVPSADERFAVHNHNKVRSATQSFQYSMEGREPHFVYIRSGGA